MDKNINSDLIISEYTGTEKNVVIPEGVQWIEAGAFRGNKDIVSVYLPKSLIHLDDEAFKDCTALRTVIIGDGCEEVGFSAFENCTALGSVILPDSIKEICGGAFKNCPRLRNVFLPANDDIDLLFTECFDGCTALARKLRRRKEAPDENIAGVIENDTLIHFDDTLTDCFTVPSSVKYIAKGAFSGCNNLVSVTIPDTVEDIEEGAFDGCPNLEEVIIADGSDIIDQYSLTDTKWYRDNEDGFFILGGTLLGYNGKSRDITVPPDVKRIAENVLETLRCAESISLPSTMAEMPDIPTETCLDPVVCVYKVDPDRAV